MGGYSDRDLILKKADDLIEKYKRTGVWEDECIMSCDISHGDKDFIEFIMMCDPWTIRSLIKQEER